MSQVHLKAGSEMPPLSKGKLRLYSMRFCPYAQRTRLVLAAKKIPYETVNINLQSKPEWYLKLNPAGQVPCLQFDDGRVIPESLINSEYLDQAYPENKLIPSDPFTSAQHKLFVERFSKTITNYYKALRGADEESINEFKAALKEIDAKFPSTGFLGGNQPVFADYMVWPWLERLEAIEIVRNIKLNKSEFPNLFGYIERMKQVPAVKEVIIKPEVHAEFYKGYLSGGEANYDLAG